MKTEALKQALDKYQFDVAFGGARRDEEKSRAKERIFSFRTREHRWDPKNQRPELWSIYNTRKERDFNTPMLDSGQSAGKHMDPVWQVLPLGAYKLPGRFRHNP